MSDNVLNIELVEYYNYQPTDEQRRAKAKFLRNYRDMPMASLDKINATMASQLSGVGSSMYRWFKEPGFREWFLDLNEFESRVEFLVQKALSRAEDMLNDPNLNQAAFVNLLKHLSEVANKIPSRAKEIRYVDAQIAKMSPSQLDAEIKRLQRALGGSSEISTEDNTNSGEED